MRIAERFEKHGYWWLPSKPEPKLPGILKISESADAELEILGVFGDKFSYDANIPRIVGIIEDGKLVTLDNCFYKNRNIRFGGISKSVIYAHLVLIGAQFEDDEAIEFSSFMFSVEGLDEWLSITGIKVKHDWEAKSATINFKPPEVITIKLPKDINLSFTFGWTIPSGSVTEAKITQKAYIKLESNSLQPLQNFMSLAFKLNNFLCFAADETVTIDSATAFSYELKHKTGKERESEVPIEVYYPSLPFSETKPKVKWHKMLFRYGSITDNIQELLTKWLDSYSRIEPAFNLYFSSKSGAHKYIDGKFLSLAQGLETFHRRTSSETIMSDDEFNSIFKSLLKACPEEKQKWLAEKLEYSNEIPLIKRLKQMIEPFKSYFGSNKNRKSLLNNIGNTRNYLTHYDSSLKDKACNGSALWKLCMKMECLFQLHFLQVLGFSKEQIAVIVDNNYQFKQKLNEI